LETDFILSVERLSRRETLGTLPEFLAILFMVFREDTDDFMKEMQKSRKGEIENVLTTISEFVSLEKNFASLT
jgi:hypothetical protein